MIHAFVKKGSFQDSVSLMVISRKLSESPEVDEVSVMMGTPANKSLLETTGFWHDQFLEATPNDICVAIRAENSEPSVIDFVSGELDAALQALAQGQRGGKKLLKVRRWESALKKLPDANLLLISIAGEYAAGLAEQAIDSDKNVMIFSDNMTLEDEVRLKNKASSKGLIVMGPDCGTAIIDGAPLAFSNVMPKGSIGVIGASGTGIQELISQVALAGQGITHTIGLGGRDLSVDVGGVSALTALEMLANDSDSKVIAFVSKPPAEEVRQKVLKAMKAINKPVIALFLGAAHTNAREGNVYLANTLNHAAELAVALAQVEEAAASHTKAPNKKIMGLYTGGTLAAEAAMLLAEQLGLETDSEHAKGIMLAAGGHKIVDLGDDFYTVGRPHPMIDPAVRQLEIAKLAESGEIGVLLLDVVLGYGSLLDPAGAVVDAVNKMRDKRGSQPEITVIATVTGTEQDPQCRSAQIKILEDAGIVVCKTLPQAMLLAGTMIADVPPAKELKPTALLNGVNVINAGLRGFAEDLQSSDIPVVHYQWAPVAGGNEKLANLLKKLQ
ncbi:acyl-CoA synthetase FdrA [Budvicia diplopodorum]|uniref:acyl-CoA synthetase FdrA n=1 Tax=Budvicia diplopodorum TaxID=1119056 RepID=UPI001357E45F|nr:acyl-CoA synthetase FdrA [Budvicia diplopodorum]